LSNPFANVRWIWKNGQLVEFEKATVHAMSHALHYGSGVFEGIRCYKTRRGPAVFRLAEHLDRLEYSARIYRMPMPFSRDELAEAILETIRANEMESCYIRPVVYRGFGTMGVNPLKSPVEAMVAVWSWGKYLGEGATEGVDVGVSTWRRPASDALPAIAKSTGGYLNSQLIKMEALSNGFVEGIALDAQGFVSEGSGENLFLVRRGTLVSPSLAASVLDGITRDAVITMAREMGIPVREELVPRALLYTCDELFMTGTAAEITPIRSVDHYAVRTCPGEITRRLLDAFMAAVTGEADDRHGWLTPVHAAREAGTAPPPPAPALAREA